MTSCPLGIVTAGKKQAVDGVIHPKTGSTNQFSGELDSFCQNDTIKYNQILLLKT
jgi:hypothetical protein